MPVSVKCKPVKVLKLNIGDLFRKVEYGENFWGLVLDRDETGVIVGIVSHSRPDENGRYMKLTEDDLIMSYGADWTIEPDEVQTEADNVKGFKSKAGYLSFTEDGHVLTFFPRNPRGSEKMFVLETADAGKLPRDFDITFDGWRLYVPIGDGWEQGRKLIYEHKSVSG